MKTIKFHQAVLIVIAVAWLFITVTLAMEGSDEIVFWSLSVFVAACLAEILYVLMRPIRWVPEKVTRTPKAGEIWRNKIEDKYYVVIDVIPVEKSFTVLFRGSNMTKHAASLCFWVEDFEKVFP